MTREMAIKILKRMIKTGIAYDDGYAYEPLTNDEKRACEVAIKELEQEQYYKDLANSYEKTINKLTKAISEQEQKTGHWIDMNHYEEWWGKEYECSECGERMIGDTEYCPYCGVRMSEVSNDD